MVEDLVLLHGFGGTRRGWDGVLEHLPAERYRPLALDLPGHGELSGWPAPLDFDACVSSVLERSPERFALVGYSMGGRIALHVALHAPGRVSRLVLVSASPGIEGERERAERRDGDDRLAAEIEAGTIEDFSRRWRNQPMFARDPVVVDRLARADQARNDPAGLAASLRGVGTGRMRSLWSELAGLRVPVTLVVGERDAKFQTIARRMQQAIEHATLRVVPGGHALPLESPAAVAGAIG